MISRMASGSNVPPDAQLPSVPDDVEQEESSSATDDEEVEERVLSQKTNCCASVYVGTSLIVYTCAVLSPLHLFFTYLTGRRQRRTRKRKRD